MNDQTNGNLLKALLFARTREDNSLIDCLANLQRAETNISERVERNVQTIIANDYSEHSFYFSRMDEKGDFYGNGGIIFHGKHDNGGDGSAPTFSVSITPVDGWSIHT